ncbi:hypothetical protein [Streptomyces sp. DH8]|uniref:hypothetical protein n=1 Tax=Streptomyces sp. DH8 TaxID=2857008 RepID=UPI001E3F7DC3|nr:hypothetical protein [Streptomyces sp. DH8]
MTTARNLRFKSLPATPNSPQAANRAAGPAGGGVPKVVAEGVRVAVLPDPHTVTVTGIRPGLTVRGLGRNQIPTADWLCACGHHERARGRERVTDLTTRARVDHCPHTEQHRRNAA